MCVFQVPYHATVYGIKEEILRQHGHLLDNDEKARLNPRTYKSTIQFTRVKLVDKRLNTYKKYSVHRCYLSMNKFMYYETEINIFPKLNKGGRPGPFQFRDNIFE